MLVFTVSVNEWSGHGQTDVQFYCTCAGYVRDQLIVNYRDVVNGMAVFAKHRTVGIDSYARYC